MLDLERPEGKLPQPKYKLPEVVPYSEDAVKAVVQSCEYTKESNTEKRRTFRMNRLTSHGDKTLILLFLDSGHRVNEVCRLRIRYVNLETGEIQVKPYGSGQKTKLRTAYLGKSARRSM